MESGGVDGSIQAERSGGRRQAGLGKGTGNTKALQFRRGGEKRAVPVGVERVIGGQPGRQAEKVKTGGEKRAAPRR